MQTRSIQRGYVVNMSWYVVQSTQSFLECCRISGLTVPQRGVYRVTHLLANLGWVDFDLGCSTILPSSSGSSANFPSAQAQPGRGWNSQNQSQPIPGSPGDGSPCIWRYINISHITSCSGWSSWLSWGISLILGVTKVSKGTNTWFSSYHWAKVLFEWFCPVR